MKLFSAVKKVAASGKVFSFQFSPKKTRNNGVARFKRLTN